MKPIFLRLRGFKGIKKGMGLEEISLDLANVTGLVALAGKNGRGKSTVLENLHPYRSLFSRDGSLNQHCFRRDSEKEFVFSYEGHTYKTLLKIDAESDRGEGFIWKDGVSVVNGKRKEYDKYIVDLLGSQFLFQNSVFCAQNSRKLTSLRTGELREMFAEFLRLDKLQAYEETAKQCGNILSGKLGHVENRIGVLKSKAEGRASAESLIENENKNLSRQAAEKTKKQTELTCSREELDRLKAAIAKNDSLSQRKADLAEQIAKVRERDDREEDKELRKLEVQYRENDAEIKQANEILKNKDAILGAANREGEINAEIEKLTAQIETLNAKYADTLVEISTEDIKTAELRQLIKDNANDQETARTDKEISELNEKIKDVNQAIKDIDNDTDVIKAESLIKATERQQEAYELKDPACQSTTCLFIVDALKARELLPTLRGQLSALKDKLNAQKAEMLKLNAALKALSDTLQEEREDRQKEVAEHNRRLSYDLALEEQGLRALREQIRISTENLCATRCKIANLKRELVTVKELATKSVSVHLAKQKHADLLTRQAKITDKGKQLRAAVVLKEQSISKEIGELTARMNEFDLSIDRTAHDELNKTEKSIKLYETITLPDIDDKIRAAQVSIAQLQTSIAGIGEAEKELKAAQEEKDKLTAHIADFTYLRNACSKTGLQALEIDGACPHIQYDANRLLSLTFGPNYSTRIITQDDDGKEVFKILVIREDGEETSLDNLSGGQKVWLLKALRLSLTLLSKNKSGRNFQAAFADEEDGALDADNAQTFVGLYRSFMQAGQFQSFFYISHKPECRSAADHILNFRQRNRH